MKLIPIARYKISGHSMEPTLKDGQIVWVNNWAYLISKVCVGDIVVFKKDSQELIKRVKKNTGDKIYLTGDNKDDSLDSRSFGKINKSDIVGKVST